MMSKIPLNYNCIIKPFVITSLQYAKFKKFGWIRFNRYGGRRILISKLMPNGDKK